MDKTNANKIYNYLKERIGDTVDDMKEFDAWFERMVWHVKECNRLAAEPKTGRDCTDFVRWLMDEVMDEENWQLNAVANGEIICRKLKKLGLLDIKDGYYVETQKTGKWIPIKWHEITEEEREREGYPKDWVVHIDCDMPCDEQEILVQTKKGYIGWDVCYEDGEFSLDSGWDWIEDIVAWMPLPEPYREDGEA